MSKKLGASSAAAIMDPDAPDVPMTGVTAAALHSKPPSDAAAQLLFEMSPDMLGTASLDGYLTEINPAWERTLGWTRRELMAEPFLSFVHLDDVDATLATLAVLARPGIQEVGAFENRCRAKAGGHRWLEWSAVADAGTVYLAAKDITRRKVVEAARANDLLLVERSEALHRTLTANLPDTTVFLLDRDLRILVADGEAIRRLPWFSPEQFIGRQVSELESLVPPRVLDQSLENYRAVLDGERRDFEFTSEGLTFAVQGVPVYSENGTIETALILARDVTYARRLTDGLRRSEERLRRAEELVGAGIWELSLDDETVTWSNGLCRIHGAMREGGHERLSDYVSRVYPADRVHFRQELARCMDTGGAAFEYRITDRAGSARTLTVEAELVQPDDGHRPYVRGAALDVTDERAGFDNAPLGMLVAEPTELRLTRVNDALCSILQRTREELLGQRIGDLTHPDDRAAVAEKQQTLIAGTERAYQPEKRYLLPDGSVVWVAVYVTALHNADGSVRAFSSHVIDITERRARRADVQTARVESLRRLAIVSEYRDNETYEHTERVGRISVAIGRALGMTEAELDLLGDAAPLHDIGKLGVPDTILLKPGRLEPDERARMQRHTLIGADVLTGSESPVLQMAEQIALTHHERWDGHGYPHQLATQAIPLVGRVVAVADVFDALTHDRPYKEAWPVDRAVAHILSAAGSHFDPLVGGAFATLDHMSFSASDCPQGSGRLPGSARPSAEARRTAKPADMPAYEMTLWSGHEATTDRLDRAVGSRASVSRDRSERDARTVRQTRPAHSGGH